jgi:hypothetical protein
MCTCRSSIALLALLASCGSGAPTGTDPGDGEDASAPSVVPPGQYRVLANNDLGMHNVDSPSWVNNHDNFYEQSHASCQVCHGANLLGTVLSKTPVDRTFSHEGHTYHLAAGQQVGCNSCHSWPFHD